jgi:hypothetical protein
MPRTAPLKLRVKIALRQFAAMDLRWSYYATGFLILCGLFVNLFFAHGWTCWPFVLAAGIMLMVHEAADRNGTGLPPLHVYAWLGGVMAFWTLLVCVLAVVNPFVLMLGIAGMGYYCGHAYLKQRQRIRLRESRRLANLCIHCGHPIDPRLVFCDHCGQEPNPDAAVLQRILSVPRSAADRQRTRAALAPESSAALSSKKEKALLARRRTGKGRK